MNARRFGVSLRTSAVSQRERETILTQEAEIRAYIERLGYDVVADAYWFRDEAVSGDVPLTERAGGGELTDFIEAGLITEAVLVYRVSRVSREDIIGYFLLEALCAERGLALRAVAEGVDTTTEEGQFLGGLHAVWARHVKRQNLAELTAGRLRKFRQGRWLTNPPFGFRKVAEGKLAIEPLKAQAIREAWGWLVHERCTLAEVGRRWEAAGVPARFGGHWISQAVRRALTNPALKGAALFRRSRPIRQGGRFIRNVPREPSEHIIVPCPAILSEAQWDELQEALRRNRMRRARTGAAARFYFLPPVFCLECRARYYIQTRARKNLIRYYCHDWKREPGKRPCRATVRADALEGIIWGEVQYAIADSDSWLASLAEQLQSGRPDLSAAYDAARQRLANLDEGRQRLARALARGTLSEAVYDRAAREVEREWQALSSTVRTLRRQVEGEQAATERLDDLAQFLAVAATLVDADADVSLAEKRRICARLLRAIRIRRGDTLEVEIEWAT